MNVEAVKAACVMISDGYDKGAISREAIEELIELPLGDLWAAQRVLTKLFAEEKTKANNKAQ